MKTKMCKSYAQDGKCAIGEYCIFAHGETELRVTDGIYKTQMCHFFERGRCLKGDRCNHAHGKEDLRMPQRSQQTPSKPKNQAASSFGLENALGAPGAAAAGAAVPLGLRSPLSPLPLSDLLGDMGANLANTPGANAANTP